MWIIIKMKKDTPLSSGVGAAIQSGAGRAHLLPGRLRGGQALFHLLAPHLL